LAEYVNNRNSFIVRHWLQAGSGLIGLYADDMGGRLVADATVLVDEGVRERQITIRSNRGGTPQGDYHPYERTGREGIIFDSFISLMDYLDRPLTMVTTIQSQKGDRLFRDICITKRDIVRHNVYSKPLGDFLHMLEWSDDINSNRRYYCRQNHPMFVLWTAVYDGFIWDKYPSIQTVMASSTIWTRAFSTIIARGFKLDDDGLHRARNRSLVERFTDAVLVSRQSYNGYIPSMGGYRVSVSGHLVNLILYPSTDMRKYLGTIERNVALYSRRSRMTRQEKRLILDGYVMEASSPADLSVLWHSYIEYVLAVDTAYIIAREANIPIELELLQYVSKRLDIMLERYPPFMDESFSASN
jgi:hypothetical protein